MMFPSHELVSSDLSPEQQFCQRLLLIAVDNARVMKDAASILKEGGVNEKMGELGMNIAADIYNIALEQGVSEQLAYGAAMEVMRDFGTILAQNANLDNDTFASMVGKSAYNNLAGAPAKTRSLIKEAVEHNVGLNNEMTGGWGLDSKTLKSMALAALTLGATALPLAAEAAPTESMGFDDSIPRTNVKDSVNPFGVNVPTNVYEAAKDVKTTIDQDGNIVWPNPDQPVKSRVLFPAPGWKGWKMGLYDILQPETYAIDPIYEDQVTNKDAGRVATFIDLGVLDNKVVAPFTTPSERKGMVGNSRFKDAELSRIKRLTGEVNTTRQQMSFVDKMKEEYPNVMSRHYQEVRDMQDSRTIEEQLKMEKEKQDDLEKKLNVAKAKLKTHYMEEELKRRQIPKNSWFWEILGNPEFLKNLGMAAVTIAIGRKTGIVKKLWDAAWAWSESPMRQRLYQEYDDTHQIELDRWNRIQRRHELVPEGVVQPLTGKQWEEYIEKEVEERLGSIFRNRRHLKERIEGITTALVNTVEPLMTAATFVGAWDKTMNMKLANEYAEIVKQENRGWDLVSALGSAAAGIAGTVVNFAVPGAGDATKKILDTSIKAIAESQKQPIPNLAANISKEKRVDEIMADAVKKIQHDDSLQAKTKIKTEPVKLPPKPLKPVAIPSTIPIKTRESITQVRPYATKGRKSLQTKVVPTFSNNPYLKQTQEKRQAQQRLTQLFDRLETLKQAREESARKSRQYQHQLGEIVKKLEAQKMNNRGQRGVRKLRGKKKNSKKN